MYASTTSASEAVGGSESEHCRAGRSLAGRAGRHLARRLQQPVRGRDRLTGACIRGQPGLRAGQALAGGGGARRAILDQVARVCRRRNMVSRAGSCAQMPEMQHKQRLVPACACMLMLPVAVTAAQLHATWGKG